MAIGSFGALSCCLLNPGATFELTASWYHTYVNKTTVYIDESQAERLGRLATASGRSQAELIREGVERVLSEAPPRAFRSMGKGRSGGKADRRWDADELYRKARGERRR